MENLENIGAVDFAAASVSSIMISMPFYDPIKFLFIFP